MIPFLLWFLLSSIVLEFGLEKMQLRTKKFEKKEEF
jgi:hypothetical protein